MPETKRDPNQPNRGDKVNGRKAARREPQRAVRSAIPSAEIESPLGDKVNDAFGGREGPLGGKTIMDYLPAAMQKLGLGGRGKGEAASVEQGSAARFPHGGKQSLADSRGAAEGGGEVPWGIATTIDKRALEKAIATLKKYKDGKRNLESRIVEEERWWKLRHWDLIRGKAGAKLQPEEARPEPTSAWMFNSIAGKHADMMDNYPEPNVLPREKGDEQDAQTLSSILPVVFERNEYERTYSRCAWYKLKHGVCAKGVFWNQELENGLGDVDIRFMDILNIFWEPGVTDLQASRNLFVVDLRDNDLLEQEYPELKGKLGGQIIDVKQYVHDDTVDVTDKSLVVDWYYKKRTPAGKTLLHLCKFVGTEILFASENDKQYAETGFYEHGRYPVQLDVLFPEEGTPAGFGYIALMKSPQLYIDKISQVVLENAMMSAKVRYMAKKSAGINREQFLDWSDPLVEYEGDVANIQPLQVQQVGSNVLNVLQMKIDELKETSSNRDVSQGSSSGGVTAAAAIAALQEAGNKTSRDMIAASYCSYTQECYLAIELIRQFYDEQRSFRITGPTGQSEYIHFSNASIGPQALPPAYPGQELEPDYVPASRKPVFDIVIKPQKRSPYSKMAQNELAKDLYRLGFFNPQLADQSLAALELMDFDGQQKVKEKVQSSQTLVNQMGQMQQQLQKMGRILYHITGQDLLGLTQGEAQAPAAEAGPLEGGGTGRGMDRSMDRSMGQAQKDALTQTMTNYGQRLAANAKTDMHRQGEPLKAARRPPGGQGEPLKAARRPPGGQGEPPL